MAKRVFDYSVDTDLPPQRVIAVATDFTDRRPDLWPTITRKQYRVYSSGPNSADVEEGTAPTRHRVSYAWTADEVVGTTTGGNAVRPGSVWRMRVTPRDGGGSHVEVHQETDFMGLFGAMGSAVVSLNGGAKYFEKGLRKALELAAEHGG